MRGQKRRLGPSMIIEPGTSSHGQPPLLIVRLITLWYRRGARVKS